MFYQDYRWQNGIPYGIAPHSDEKGYKITMDPYRKRICIELYGAALPQSIYDSALLDFRHLRRPELSAWQKSVFADRGHELICLLRDQEDHLLFVETHHFVEDLCRQCQIHSLHGIHLSTQKMFYTLLGDPFDGVVLFDANSHPVCFKRYKFDKESQQFTELLEESWNGEFLPGLAGSGTNPNSLS